jgi:hypothetical protein
MIHNSPTPYPQHTHTHSHTQKHTHTKKLGLLFASKLLAVMLQMNDQQDRRN